MSLKGQRLRIRLLVHGGVISVLVTVFLIGSLVRDEATSAFFGFLIILYALTMRINPIPRILERKQINKAECSFCGEVIDLLGNWTCGCGYVTWEPRHALSACPNCKKEFEWIECPRCEGSIVI